MIRVAQRGEFDCMTACLASVFEAAYEDCPILVHQETGRPVADWRGVYDRWLAERGWAVLERVRDELGHDLNPDGEPDDPMRCPWHLPGYWIASVRSPRNDGTHGIVMSGGDEVWDPHPGREQGHLGFVGCEYFLPLDPAKFRLRRRAAAGIFG